MAPTDRNINVTVNPLYLSAFVESTLEKAVPKKHQNTTRRTTQKFQ